MIKDKIEKYDVYLEKIYKCKRCQLQNKKCYTATGPITATIMIIGQAPSLYRKSPEHFSEKSKRAFERFLEELHIRRDKVWITNTVKCIEPKKKTGSPEQCSTSLREEIKILKPREIFLFGKVATVAVFGKPLMYSSFKREADGILYHILPHPMTAVYDRADGRSKYVEEIARVKEYRLTHHIKNVEQAMLGDDIAIA